MNTSKKARRELYTNYEKKLLLELISERISIIECKQTNKTTLLQKQEAFAAIAEAFNASMLVDTKRSVKQIREWYKSNKKSERVGKLTTLRHKTRASNNSSAEVPSRFTDRLVDRHLEKLPIPAADGCNIISSEQSSELLLVENPDEADVIIPDVSTPPLSLCDELSTDVDFKRDFRDDCLDSTRISGDNLQTEGEQNTNRNNTLSQEAYKELSSKKETVLSPTARAAAAIEEEKKFQMKVLANAERRKDEEHAARMLEHSAKIKLLNTKQQVQEKLLEYLQSNPSSLNITLK